MIILPVFSLEDIAYGVYDTAVIIAIASEYGCDVYDNVLEKLSSKTASYEDIIFLVTVTYTRYPFWGCEIIANIPRKCFALVDAYLTPLYQCVQ